MNLVIAVLFICLLVWLSVQLTNYVDRRRTRTRPTLETERTEDGPTILARRRAERARQLDRNHHDWE